MSAGAESFPARHFGWPWKQQACWETLLITIRPQRLGRPLVPTDESIASFLALHILEQVIMEENPQRPSLVGVLKELWTVAFAVSIIRWFSRSSEPSCFILEVLQKFHNAR